MASGEPYYIRCINFSVEYLRYFGPPQQNTPKITFFLKVFGFRFGNFNEHGCGMMWGRNVDLGKIFGNRLFL